MSKQANTKSRAGTRRQPRERGQSLVETAIVFPVLLLLLAAVVDFGRAFDAYIVLTNAAREGARWGSVNPELAVDVVKQIVIDDVLGSGTNITDWTGFGSGNVTVFGQLEKWDFVRVTVTYDFDFWFGGLIGVPQVTLTKTSEMPRWRTD
jgi:Flp pilus assembly protein TadG